jgi:LacI family transcriptional regulator
MADVARAAGVAGSTVSHVLNGTRPVSEETARRVQEAIKATGYRYNSLARSLATNRTKTIGLAISVLSNPYFGSLVNAIERVASQEGFTLVLADTHDDAALERHAVNTLLDRRVDGLILAPAPASRDGAIPTVVTSGTPLVLIDRQVDIDCDQFVPENTDPVKILTRHLLDLGHTTIGAITGIEGISSTDERRDAFVSVMEEAGLSARAAPVLSGQSTVEGAYAACMTLFNRGIPPTGLVVLNNAMTIGTMKALRELGRKVPSDVALVCFDDFEWAEFFEPRLTTMAQDVELMGANAVQALLSRVAGNESSTKIHHIAPEFKHRHSCGCPDL